jgi:hypothetical protein
MAIDPEFGEEQVLPGIETDTTATDEARPATPEEVDEMGDQIAEVYQELLQDNAALSREILSEADPGIALPIQLRLTTLRLDTLVEVVLRQADNPALTMTFAVEYETRANAYLAELASQIRQAKLAI